MDFEFKVFTLNCWGIVLISPDRRKRIKAIAEFLVNRDYDVVCLQEVWSTKDFFLIKEKVSGNLPYSHYFYSGVLGSGVCVLSKHKIEEVFFHQWAVNGYFHKLHHGDWFGGKGVGLCKIKYNNYKINIYSAHLHAEYNRNSDEYQAHRVLQAYDTAQFILITSGDADLVILAGDLNTEPGDLAYRLLLGTAGLRDSFLEADRTIVKKVATNECCMNSYTSSYSQKNKIPGKRIDYVLYHPGSNMKVHPKDYKLPLPDRVPDQDFSYSDHEAIEATFLVTPSDSPRKDINLELKGNALLEGINICNHAVKSLKRHRWMYSFFAFVIFASLIITLIFDVPTKYFVPYNILQVFLGLIMFFCIIMATIWNSIEKRALVAGEVAMKVSLRCLNDK